MTLRVAQPWSLDLVRFVFFFVQKKKIYPPHWRLMLFCLFQAWRLPQNILQVLTLYFAVCSWCGMTHGCFSQNVLRDLRDCMSWRLSDATLPRPCVWVAASTHQAQCWQAITATEVDRCYVWEYPLWQTFVWWYHTAGPFIVVIL